MNKRKQKILKYLLHNGIIAVSIWFAYVCYKTMNLEGFLLSLCGITAGVLLHLIDKLKI